MANSQISPVEVAIDALTAYLKAQIPELKQVINDFPTPNLQLDYPTLTISHQAPDGSYESFMPYEDSISDPFGNKISVVWVCGQWDFKIQLDFWSGSIPDRDRIFQKAFQALNPKINPMGLRLQMKDYFNVWAAFDVNGFDHADNEQASQRGEWRSIITLLVTANQVLTENVAAITQPLELELDIVDTVIQ